MSNVYVKDAIENMLKRLSNSRKVSFGDYLEGKVFGCFKVVEVKECSDNLFSVDVMVENIMTDGLSNYGNYVYNDFLMNFNEFNKVDLITINEDFYEFVESNYYDFIVKCIEDKYSNFVSSYLSRYPNDMSFDVNFVYGDFFKDYLIKI